MKLVSITHNRCDEWDGQLYMFAPDEWTQDDIQNRVDEAVKESIADASELQMLRKPPSQFIPYDRFPDKKVSEVQAMQKKSKEEYDTWMSTQSKLTKSFESRLRAKGFLSISDQESVSAEAYWGHNHGLTLPYKATDL